ncbi:cytochrome b5 domain-containing protein [Methanolobus sp. ZRKC3]|uniref:cytochrome b5 domain-containing protein n=1 Tax=Methanolobus sp. ZRKC3 TaxID=3125786 RepID=UPI003251B37B
MQEFTLEEVAKYNGKDNEKIYVVYSGKVYDVTNSDFWVDGEHMGLHNAGEDLTESLDLEAPHESDSLDDFEVVGIIKE